MDLDTLNKLLGPLAKAGEEVIAKQRQAAKSKPKTDALVKRVEALEAKVKYLEKVQEEQAKIMLVLARQLGLMPPDEGPVPETVPESNELRVVNNG